MKRFLSLIALVLVCQINAQVTYYNAERFPLIGKTSDETETRYERLPTYLKEVTRSPVWNLGKNSAGLAIRFNSNSTSISARWEVLGNNQMNHMADTGFTRLAKTIFEAIDFFSRYSKL